MAAPTKKQRAELTRGIMLSRRLRKTHEGEINRGVTRRQFHTMLSKASQPVKKHESDTESANDVHTSGLRRVFLRGRRMNEDMKTWLTEIAKARKLPVWTVKRVFFSIGNINCLVAHKRYHSPMPGDTDFDWRCSKCNRTQAHHYEMY